MTKPTYTKVSTEPLVAVLSDWLDWYRDHASLLEAPDHPQVAAYKERKEWVEGALRRVETEQGKYTGRHWPSF